MKRTSRGASAPKFLVVTDSTHFTTYTGTRNQLLALGIARPDHFPEGRKRLKCHFFRGACDHPDNFETTKLKGGIFQFKKFHPARSYHEYDIEPIVESFVLFPKPDGRYSWSLSTRTLLDDETDAEFTSAAYRLLDLASKARLKPVKRSLTLVKPASALPIAPTTGSVSLCHSS